ncbi:hypothetical protein VM1G_11968 [Cytospora mali]|uniref:Uncharacterized protein n=1 Tax=Cytospora mali TaxID=578113 RepID=A0A194WCU5_CYTMA|nr:hypothetical protein VM1G_11968 [Valsa mali]
MSRSTSPVANHPVDIPGIGGKIGLEDNNCSRYTMLQLGSGGFSTAWLVKSPGASSPDMRYFTLQILCAHVTPSKNEYWEHGPNNPDCWCDKDLQKDTIRGRMETFAFEGVEAEQRDVLMRLLEEMLAFDPE